MCSLDESERDCPLPKKQNEHGDNIQARICFKCKVKPSVVVTRVNDAMCKECFQVYTTHKFRSEIGKSKLVRDGDKVLVAFSGGQSSSTLLHLIREGLSERAHKKLRFIPGLVYVDDGSVVGLDMSARKKLTHFIRLISEQSGFPCFIVSIEDVIRANYRRGLDKTEQLTPSNKLTSGKDENCVSDTMPEKGSSTEEDCASLEEQSETDLTRLLSTFKSLSSKEEFLRLLRQRVFLDIAKQHGYSKVMMGECSTRLSVRMMTDIARGKGAHAALDTAFADSRDPDVVILRPLRDFSSRDVAMFNVLFDVKSCFTPTLTTKVAASASIEHATEAFITGLQTDFPSTVSNIMRTAEKLVSSGNVEQTPCCLCKGPLDTNVPLASALNAVEFSKSVSKNVSCNDPLASCCGEGDGSCAAVPRLLTQDELNARLCYSCRITVSEMNEKDRIPDWLLADTLQSVRRSEMKAQIQEYLLDDSEIS